MRSCDRRKRQRLRLGHRPASDPVPQLRREPGKELSLLSSLWRTTLNQRSKSKKRHRWVNGGVGDFLLFQKHPTETLSTLIRLQVVPHLFTASLVLDTEETIIIGDHHTEAFFFHLARMFHESLAATADMTVLPGVLGCRALRRTIQVRLAPNTLRLPGGTSILTVSRQQFIQHPA